MPFELKDLLGALTAEHNVARDQVHSSKNRILQNLGDDCAGLLNSLATPVRLGKGDILARAHEEISRAIFVDHGIISLVAETDEAQELEVGLVGREGLFGAKLVLQDRTSFCRGVVQVAGEGLAIDMADLALACETHPALRSIIARFLRSLQIQTSYTALINGKFNFEHKLARWLLMVDDRVPGHSMMLTHDLLALMLGAHRPGVTIALRNLEGHGFIRSMRGEVRIRDRAALVRFAGGSYGIPEREYRRLMGLSLSTPTDRASQNS